MHKMYKDLQLLLKVYQFKIYYYGNSIKVKSKKNFSIIYYLNFNIKFFFLNNIIFKILYLIKK